MPLPDENASSLAVGAIKVDAEKASSSLVERAVGHYALLLYFFIDWGREGKERHSFRERNNFEIRLTKFGTNMQPSVSKFGLAVDQVRGNSFTGQRCKKMQILQESS